MSFSSVLDELNQAAQADANIRKQQVPLAQIVKTIEGLAAPIDPLPKFKSGNISIIAEVKRESPSKGELASITDPAGLAQQYQLGGASAISVLTQRHRFSGSLADLEAVRAAVDLPVLRKDFIIDEYMIYEARAYRADLILLIVASLPDKKLAHFYQTAVDLGLTPLVEVHTEQEAERALELGAKLIGINNRNLKTLAVDISQFEKLSALIPDSVVKVAESGLFTAQDVLFARNHGADAVLIGEALVRDRTPKKAIEDMLKAVACASNS